MIEVLKKFLTKDKFLEFKDSFYSHPNYPSLLAVTDSLTLTGIENIAANIPLTHFSHLPNSFIAELYIEERPDYYLLKKDGEVILVENKDNKTLKVDSDKLQGSWTGNCLLIEKEKDITVNSKRSSKEYYVYAILLISMAAALLLFQFDFFQSLYLLVSVAGTVVSAEIVKTLFSANDGHAETKFCSFKKEFSCSTIINSNVKIFSGHLEFVDLPIWFFTFSFSQLLFVHQASSLIGWFSFFSLPVVVYSLYVQKFVVKKWCLLCLFVSFLLISNSLILIMSPDKFDFEVLNLITSVFLLFLTGIVWFVFKKITSDNMKAKMQLNGLLRFKRNEAVFDAVSKPVNYIEELKMVPKISMGNVEAKNKLILFLSPGCHHCNTAYEEGIEIIKKYPDNIYLEIGFNLNVNNLENPSLVIAKMILYLFNNGLNYKEAIIDRYVKKMELEKWKDKWLNTDYDLRKENEQLEKQYLWCAKNGFNYSPLKIFNNRLLDSNYEINEMIYFFEE